LLAAIAVLGQGCATVTRGTTQAWTVETDPVGAQITLSSGETCQSPCTLKKRRKHGFGVNIRKPGYESVDTKVVASVSGAGAAGMAGNVIVGGLIGVAVDASTGATKELKPNPLVVKLVPIAQPKPAATEPATTE
jgi:hypothetical protein